MSDSRQLLEQFLAQAWDTIDAFSRAVADSEPLRMLPPDPGFTQPPFKDHVLQQIASLPLPDAISTAAFALLRTLLPPAVSPDDPVRMHGWDPGDGTPRTLALIARLEGALATVAVVFGRAANGAALVRVVGNAPAPAAATLSATPALDLNLHLGATGTLDCEFRRDLSRVREGSAAGTLALRLAPHENTPVRIGLEGGPSLTFEGIAASVELALPPGAVTPVTSTSVAVEHLDLEVLPGTLRSLVGDVASPRVSLDLSAAADGLQFASRSGGGTQVTAANLGASGAVQITHVGLELGSGGRADAPLQLGVRLGVNGRVPGLPVGISADGAGAAFGFSVGRAGLFGFKPSEVLPLPPMGIGAELALPVAKGSGFLIETREGGFAGEFDLDLGFVGVRALALLSPAGNGRPLSLAILISVEFPYPGIQLGLGFSLNGVGGLVAINRRADLPALQASVLDGSVGALLSPASASGHPASALMTLGRIFPEAPGHFVVGPLLHLAWGGRLMTMSLALIFDLPNPPTLVILGRLTIAIPDPAAPLILISLTFVGGFDPSVPTTHLLGTLQGSHLLGVPIQGDGFILVAGGRNPALVISAGGFHPEYPRPASTPELRRIAFELCPLPFPRLRAEMYFALTSNSVQFGAGVYLSATIADCGLEGRFQFDALCVFAPDFMFVARCSARVAVEVFGETLMGISLDIRLQGPSPWLVQARGSVSILWEDISLDFEVGWGDPPRRLPHDVNLEAELRRAFLEPKAWMPDDVGADRSGVTVRRATKGRPAAIHPLGRMQARQRLIPFDIVVHRYQGLPLDRPQLWTLLGATVRDAGTPERFVTDLRDEFPRAQYFDLTDGDQLSARGFSSERSGGVMVPSDSIAGHVIESPDDAFDEKIVPAPGEPETPRVRHRAISRIPQGLPFYELAAAGGDIHQRLGWWRGDGRLGVAVSRTQPLAVAQVDTLRPVAFAEPLDGRSLVQASQMVAAAIARGVRGVQLVEALETKRTNQ